MNIVYPTDTTLISIEQVAPNKLEAQFLLISLRRWENNGDGKILTFDGLLGASREEAYIVYSLGGGPVITGETTTNCIRVDWALKPDGIENTFFFIAEPWKGASGIAQRIRQHLKQIAISE